MTPDDVLNLPGEQNPCLCRDGLLGMLILYPHKGSSEVGIQVYGEHETRKIDCEDLWASEGGALRQRGAPFYPKSTEEVQLLLLGDFKRRGGFRNVPIGGW